MFFIYDITISYVFFVKKTTYFLSSFIFSSARLAIIQEQIIKDNINIINKNKIINNVIVNKFILSPIIILSFYFVFIRRFMLSIVNIK